MAAERSSRTATSRSPHAASCEAPLRATVVPSEETTRTTALAVLARVMKWAGVALLVIGALMGVYLGAGLLGELAVRAAYP
jgi:hypothetical protein